MRGIVFENLTRLMPTGAIKVLFDKQKVEVAFLIKPTYKIIVEIPLPRRSHT